MCTILRCTMQKRKKKNFCSAMQHMSELCESARTCAASRVSHKGKIIIIIEHTTSFMNDSILEHNITLRIALYSLNRLITHYIITAYGLESTTKL